MSNKKIFFILFLLNFINIFSFEYFPSSSLKNIIQKGSLICKKNFISDSLFISQSKSLITEKANFNEIHINQLKTEEIEINSLETNLIIPNNKENTLILNGEIFVTGQISFDNSEIDYNSILKEKKEENDKKIFLEQNFIQIENENEIENKEKNENNNKKKEKNFKQINIENNLFENLNENLNKFIIEKNKRIEFNENLNIKINKKKLKNKNYLMLSFSLKKLEIFDIATFYIKNQLNEFFWVSESKENNNNKIDCNEFNFDNFNILIPINNKNIKNDELNLIFGVKMDRNEIINELRECNNNNDLINFDNLEIFLK